MNPALARGLGVMLKLDFQRAVLQRIPQIAAQSAARRGATCCSSADEYHAFATVGRNRPDRRRARVRAVAAGAADPDRRDAEHQLAAVGAGQATRAWRTLLQCFRTKVFLATSDEFTARIAAELCGRARPAEGAVHARGSGRRTRTSRC